MSINQEDVAAAKEVFVPDEVPLMTARQRRFGPGGSMIEPTSVIATSKRVIIINRSTLGIRKDYETIPYSQIASVRLEKGMISASVNIRILGYDTEKDQIKGKEEGEIDGLTIKDAKALSDLINEKILELQEKGEAQTGTGPYGGYKYCDHCGTKNNADADYCANCGEKLGPLS